MFQGDYGAVNLDTFTRRHVRGKNVTLQQIADEFACFLRNIGFSYVDNVQIVKRNGDVVTSVD